MATTRRVRTRSGSSAGKQDKAKAQEETISLVQGKLRQWAAEEKKMLAAQKAKAELEEEISKAMKEAELTYCDSETVEAKIVTPVGKSSTVIDVAKFRKAVPDNAFLECVTIGVTKAKKHLSEKELEKISTKIPGKSGDPVLTVKQKKIKK